MKINEAIDILKVTGSCLDKRKENGKASWTDKSAINLINSAILVAVKSMNALGDAYCDILEYVDEYSETDANGNHCQKWCAMEEARKVLAKRIDEVES